MKNYINKKNNINLIHLNNINLIHLNNINLIPYRGEGLGKHKQGIKKAISVGIKNDTNGLGKDTNSWGFAWWDHVYNKSAANMNIEKTEDGVCILKIKLKKNKKTK